MARYVKGCPDTEIMFEWPKAPRRLVVQSDSDWARDTSTRKSVSAGNLRYRQHLLRSWSQDQTVIAMSSGEAELYVACMAAQQAMGTKNMARELGVHLDAMELQVDANAAIGIIGWQGLGKLRHLDFDLFVAAVTCARKAGQPEESTVGEQHAGPRDEGAREG